jgi:homoserine dehydrogenase
VTLDDPLYHVDGSFNAVTIEGAHSGTITLQGLGAGGHPTASAMVGDLMNIPVRE